MVPFLLILCCAMPIIINGEIIPDSDPRAKAARAQKASPTAAGQGPRFGSINQSGDAPSHTADRPPAHGGAGFGRPGAAGVAGAGPLDQLAEFIGVRGKTITVPAIPPIGMPAVAVEYIHIIIVGVMCVFFGWQRVLLISVGLFFFLNHPKTRQR